MTPMKTYNEARKLYERKIKEEDILKEIVFRLRAAGIKIFRERENVYRTGWADRGHPDLHGWVPKSKTTCKVDRMCMQCNSIPVYIEVKRPGGKHRPEQEQFIREAREDGCIACFAESWEQVVEEFGKQGIILPK